MAEYERDAFDEVDEALHLGGLFLAVLNAHGCGCVHCAKAWDALDEYPEFAGSPGRGPEALAGSSAPAPEPPTTSQVASHGGASPQRGIGGQGRAGTSPAALDDGEADA